MSLCDQLRAAIRGDARNYDKLSAVCGVPHWTLRRFAQGEGIESTSINQIAAGMGFVLTRQTQLTA